MKKRLLKTQSIWLCAMNLLAGIMLIFSLTGCDLFSTDDGSGNSVIEGGGGTTAGTQLNPIVFTDTNESGTYSLTSTVQAGWFRFTANGRYTLTVRDKSYTPTSATTSPYTVDARVSVLDATLGYVSDINNRQMNAVDIGGNNNADVTLTDLLGVYFVRIDPYNSGGTGSFYISVSNAGPITTGSGQLDAIDITSYSPVPFQLELTSSRPARWFKFTADGRYTLTVRDRSYSPTGATTSPYTVDARVSVLDATLGYVSDINNRQMNEVDIGSNTNADVTLTDLTGVFYVKVDPYNTNNYGSFYIALDKTGTVTAGSGQLDAIPLIIGAPRVSNEITSSRPSRWFSFTVIAAGNVDLTVFDSSYTPAGLLEEKPTVDVRVSVLDMTLNFVSDSGGRQMNAVDIGANNQSPVAFNLSPGIYYVKIDPYNQNNFGFFYIGVN